MQFQWLGAALGSKHLSQADASFFFSATGAKGRGVEHQGKRGRFSFVLRRLDNASCIALLTSGRQSGIMISLMVFFLLTYDGLTDPRRSESEQGTRIELA